MTDRYIAKLFIVSLVFLVSTGVYQSAAYGFYNPLKAVKGSIAESNGDDAYENKDYPTAFAEYKKAAEAGSPYGQFMLANMYLTGQSVKKDLSQYMYWLAQSAENDYPPANYLMGMAYLYSDKSKAADYLKAAADKEHGSSMHMLGMMYAKGVGVSKSTDEAVRWFRLARAQGIPVSNQLLNPATVEASLNKRSTPKTQKSLVKEIQQRLTHLGYKPGPADGLYGKKTRNAIIGFQKKNGMNPDGLATVGLLNELKIRSQ